MPKLDPYGSKIRIGRREYLSFPDWKVGEIRAKVDTGAKTTAVDVAAIEELEDGRVRFELILHRGGGVRRKKKVTAEISRRTRVRSSNGKREERIFVLTTVAIGPVEKQVEVGLVCRKRMQCRALIGRTAMGRDFLIDPSRKYLLEKRRREK